MTNQTALEKTNNTSPRAIQKLAAALEIKPEAMTDVIKAQCFRSCNAKDISNEQLAAYVSVANSLAEQAPGFNPLLPGMLYAFPAKNGGIEPMVGPDGIFCLLKNHSDVDSWETEVEFDDKNEPFACVAKIYLKSTQRPATKRVYLHEWANPSNPNWKQRPCHMLEVRAIKQAARMVIHGIPLDEQEREIANFVEAEITSESKEELSASARFAKKHLPEAKKEEPTIDDEEELEIEPDPADEIPVHGGEAYFADIARERNPFGDVGRDAAKWNEEWDTAEKAEKAAKKREEELASQAGNG